MVPVSFSLPTAFMFGSVFCTRKNKDEFVKRFMFVNHHSCEKWMDGWTDGRMDGIMRIVNGRRRMEWGSEGVSEE